MFDVIYIRLTLGLASLKKLSIEIEGKFDDINSKRLKPEVAFAMVYVDDLIAGEGWGHVSIQPPWGMNDPKMGACRHFEELRVQIHAQISVNQFCFDASDLDPGLRKLKNLSM